MMPAFSRTPYRQSRSAVVDALNDLEHDVGLEFRMPLHGEDADVVQVQIPRVGWGTVAAKADEALNAAVDGGAEHC